MRPDGQNTGVSHQTTHHMEPKIFEVNQNTDYSLRHENNLMDRFAIFQVCQTGVYMETEIGFTCSN